MIDFLLDCSLWYTSCSKLKGIATQKPDRATLQLIRADSTRRMRAVNPSSAR